jgi:hypothetical protein
MPTLMSFDNDSEWLKWRSTGVGEYEVSNTGVVRRKVLKQYLKRGYYQVSLSLGKRGVRKYVAVHTLVAEAFIGQRPPNTTVNHKDLVKTNNDSRNLEYLSIQDNLTHAQHNGHWPLGEKNGRAKLSQAIVSEIRTTMLPTYVWVRKLGVDRATVNRARRGATWLQ